MSKEGQKEPEKVIKIGRNIPLLMGNTFYAIMLGIMAGMLLSPKHGILTFNLAEGVIACLWLAFSISYFMVDWLDTNFAPYIDMDLKETDIVKWLSFAFCLAAIGVITILGNYTLALALSAIYHILATEFRGNLIKIMEEEVEKAESLAIEILYSENEKRNDFKRSHELYNIKEKEKGLLVWMIICGIVTGFAIFAHLYLKGAGKNKFLDPNYPLIIAYCITWGIALKFKLNRHKFFILPRYLCAIEKLGEEQL